MTLPSTGFHITAVDLVGGIGLCIDVTRDHYFMIDVSVGDAQSLSSLDEQILTRWPCLEAAPEHISTQQFLDVTDAMKAIALLMEARWVQLGIMVEDPDEASLRTARSILSALAGSSPEQPPRRSAVHEPSDRKGLSSSAANNTSARKKILTGEVLSCVRQKTISVRVSSRVKHPQYGKYVRQRTKYHVHDEDEMCSVGDIVSFYEVRPISKTKCHTLFRVVTPSASARRG